MIQIFRSALCASSCVLVLISASFSCIAQDWIVIDDFEDVDALERWQKADTKNETEPRIENPQVTEVRAEKNGNHYLYKKPAEEGVIGNRKALTFAKLPHAIDLGETYSIYLKFQIESFPNNHIFGLSNLGPSGIIEHDYNAFEPSVRITDKAESNGLKNDGTLMVRVGGAYKKVINFRKEQISEPLEIGTWYEIWLVVNNDSVSNGGQSYDLFLKGGEFKQQSAVYLSADFRMQREQPLTYFLLNANTGPFKSPYGNGAVLYDELYMSAGKNLSVPL